MRRRTMWRHSTPFRKRNGVVFAEIVHVDAAADEPAAFVERNLSHAQIARTDFEKMDPGRTGRGDGVAEHGRGDALALVFGDDGDIDHFGRERPRVQEYILAEDFPVTTCDIGCAAVGVVGYGLFRFVGQQQQVALRRVCLYNFEIHVRKAMRRLRRSPVRRYNAGSCPRASSRP